MFAWKSFAAATLLAVAVSGPVFAQTADSEAEAAVRTWLDAVMSGDPARLDAVLAPEFQIQRADGTGYDKAGYVGGGFAQLTNYDVRDLVATRNGDFIVARYMLVVAETIDGRPVEALAPRLTVFRREGDNWLVVAHGNFARIAQ